MKMKMSIGLFAFLASLSLCLGAVYPAATNAPNTFFYQCTFKGGIIVEGTSTVLDLTNLTVTTTGTVKAGGFVAMTNSQPGTLIVTLNGGQYDLQTNGAVPFVGVTGKGSTNYNSAAVNIWSTSGGPYLISAPANCFLVGTPYVTNWTICSFNYNPTLNKTNLLCVPVY